MTDSEAFFVAKTVPGTVHDIRYTRLGAQYLKLTGGYRDYMQTVLDSKKRPFLAWDGEAWNDNTGWQRYMLLQNSYGGFIQALELDTASCLDFIIQTAVNHPSHIHVIYGGGYDATQILKDLPLQSRLALKDNNEVIYSVQASPTTMRNRYSIKYLPHKWLEIQGYHWPSRRYVKVKIFDLMTFFQTSFIKALQSRGLEVDNAITTGKAGRNDFSYDDVDEVRAYCQLEVEALVKLAGALRDEFDEAGITVNQFHGPGAVASAVYKQYNVRPHMSAPPVEVELASQHAYFGGHFEQYRAGHYEGPVWLYDINSAYPYQIAQLPSLAGAVWSKTDRFHGQPGVWFCRFDSEDTQDFLSPNPTPWRGKGGAVGYPQSNAGVWLWHHEAKYATEVLYGYELHTSTDTLPFSFVHDMYNTRKVWQALGKGGERALKLALNSLYGKMAQRIGGNPERNGGKPAWHNLEWAGMVTSGTRAQLWDAVQLAPDSIIAVETDSVMSTKPLDLDIGKELGQWGVSQFDWVTYVQSGIYFTSAETGVSTGSKARTRGIDVTQLSHEQVLAFLDGDQKNPLLVNSRQFIGLGNPRTYLYGQWQDGVKEVRVAGQKRLHDTRSCRACRLGHSMATHLHDLIANPLYGASDSLKHPLPWVDGVPVELEPERGYVGDAVENWDVVRRANRSSG